MKPLQFPTIVLASASPRRSELLRQLGVAHRVLAVDVDESALPGESAQTLVERLARDKALAGLTRDGAGLPVLGADTVVVVDGQIFGKPVDSGAALTMLEAMSGRWHQVLTAVAIAMPGPHGQLRTACSATAVKMRSVTRAEAVAYWHSGEPVGKAGGYAIQGIGAAFIEEIRGSYSGVMGLPLYETAQLLQAWALE
jgi:septum formation protein